MCRIKGLVNPAFFVSSDAHQLGDILEAGHPLSCAAITPQGIVEALRCGEPIAKSPERSAP